jgi:DNA polymerase I
MGFSLTDTASENANNSGTGRDSGSIEREKLKLITLEYSIESEGNFVDEPIVELFCRDSAGTRRRIDVEGFYPSFYITEDEFTERSDDLLTDHQIRHIEVREAILSEEMALNGAIEPVGSAPRERLDGTKCVRIYAVKPSQVAKLRDTFDWHGEADVFFTNRFLIDSGIDRGLTAPRGKQRVDVSEIEPLPSGEEPDVDPRMHTVDIEVWSGGTFPEPDEAANPVTAISAHDSYTDSYFSGILHPSQTSVGDGYDWPEELRFEKDVFIYQNENRLLAEYFEFVSRTNPDLLTGWNSSSNDNGSGFDYPYLINRALNINEQSVYNLSYENGGVFTTNGGRAVVDGREMFDMLQAYKKTQIHEKRSYALEYIAQQELGQGKEDIEDLDDGWLCEPEKFMKYNIRDVDAVVEIESSKRVLEMYDHIREIAGATYSEIADSNIGIIDMLYLRRARDKGFCLPTSTRPDTQHYWGAYVFDPQAGKQENVVYPDLSSLYPNLFRDMNVSPETIIGDESDLSASQFSKDQCYTIYVDERSEQAKRDADSPERSERYVLKPDVKESFVSEVVKDLIDMKYEYKSDEYADEAYAAVKRIVNSVYGVMGDSVSYGKGFRLFDWRIAESITLAGRDVIKHTANEFESHVKSMGYTDAEIVSGDTDSCVCAVRGADGTYDHSPFDESEAASRVAESPLLDEQESPVDSALHETLLAAIEAAEHVDESYDALMQERFDMDSHNMSVEIESYSESALFMNKKKRYGQWVRWDEGDYVDEVEFKGFELVRSDSASITTDVQKGVLSRILQDDSPKLAVGEYMEEQWERVVEGDVSLNAVGRPSAIRSDLWTYGYSKQDDGSYNYYTPQPHIRGARYAKEHIDGENISSNKPLMFYCTGVNSLAKIPETYQYPNKLKAGDTNPEMHEEGRRVDAVTLSDTRNMPSCIRVDWDKMAEKTLRDPIEPIVRVMGWSFDSLITPGTQDDLSTFF